MDGHQDLGDERTTSDNERKEWNRNHLIIQRFSLPAISSRKFLQVDIRKKGLLDA
jgi:hypothetical protein